MKILTVFALTCAMMILTSGTKKRNSCRSGWYKYNSRCFLYVPREMTWAHAEKNCLSMGANLASVHTTNEYLRIKAMIASRTHQYPETWIGGSDAQEEGSWFWSDGSPFKFSFLCKGEPNNYWRQHCLAINHADNKCWDDKKCHKHLPSVCAKKIM